jgi:predicted ATPase with chaperone activity
MIRRGSVVVHKMEIQRYVGRISGPLLDRIDIHIDVLAVKFRELAGDDAPETDSSETIRHQVIVARERRLKRFHGEKIFSNAAMTPRMIRYFTKLIEFDTLANRVLVSGRRSNRFVLFRRCLGAPIKGRIGKRVRFPRGRATVMS